MSRLQDALEKWRGTPYAKGQEMPGVGVTCWRFACAVLDEVHGLTTLRPPESWPAVAILRAMLRAYAPVLVVSDLAAGDVVAVDGPEGLHVFVADDDLRLWHAAPGRVSHESLATAGTVRRIYRVIAR